jgi:hypothetical protein
MIRAGITRAGLSCADLASGGMTSTAAADPRPAPA